MTKNIHRMGLIREAAVAGKPLGRHIHFDERSKEHRFAIQDSSLSVTTKLWNRTVAPFNQGDVGACTGMAAAGVISTDPFHKKTLTYDEHLALKIYAEATRLDNITGYYPKADTGSTVLAAMKSLHHYAYIKSYKWCFSLHDVLMALSHHGPVEVGVGWYDGFDNPSSLGLVMPTGEVRGGHAFQLIGVDAEHRTITAVNSWGTEWGVNGRFTFSWDTLKKLLAEDGEAATVNM